MQIQTTPSEIVKSEKLKILSYFDSINTDDIILNDSGWDNRVYEIKDKDIYVKFPRSSKITERHRYEILVLKELIGKNITVKTPEIIDIAKDNGYFIYKGIKGDILSNQIDLLNDSKKVDIGDKLGSFLIDLHSIKSLDIRAKEIDDEVGQLEEWSKPALKLMQSEFSAKEFGVILDLIQNKWPAKLNQLGSSKKLCHADFHFGNIILGENTLGVIDFGDVCYIDNSADFKAINNKVVLDSMLLKYGADDLLLEKIKLRSQIFEVTKLTANIGKSDSDGITRALNRIKALGNI